MGERIRYHARLAGERRIHTMFVDLTALAAEWLLEVLFCKDVIVKGDIYRAAYFASTYNN